MNRLNDNLSNEFYEMKLCISRPEKRKPKQLEMIARAVDSQWRNRYCFVTSGIEELRIRSYGYLDGRDKRDIHNELVSDIRRDIGDCEISTYWTSLDYFPFDFYVTEEKEVEK